jgi:hypothetical protein
VNVDAIPDVTDRAEDEGTIIGYMTINEMQLTCLFPARPYVVDALNDPNYQEASARMAQEINSGKFFSVRVHDPNLPPMPSEVFQVPPTHPTPPYFYSIIPTPPVLGFVQEPSHGNVIPNFVKILAEEGSTTVEIAYPEDLITTDITYLNVFHDKRHQIQYNPWTQDIRVLRHARYINLYCIQGIARILLRKGWRLRIDSLPDDHATRHYFYHHNPFFRYVAPDKPDCQGFGHVCFHLDRNPILDPQPLFIRNPRLHPNPLLTWEEDEFLFHASIIFALFDKQEMATVIRLNRDVNIFMKDSIRELLEAGYLDPLNYFDNQGRHRPIHWDLRL